jgi:hypothetical protein
VSRLKDWEHGMAFAALLISISGFAVTSMQTCSLRDQVNEEITHNRSEDVYEYLTTIYERRSCQSRESESPTDDVPPLFATRQQPASASTVDPTAYCSLDDPLPDGVCQKQCWPAKETRLRQSAVLALLMMEQQAGPARWLMSAGQDTWDLVLNHAVVPWLGIPDKQFPRVAFYAADLRCSDFRHGTFKALSLEYADLRDAWFREPLPPTILWFGAICPDGTRVDAPEGTCAGHLTRRGTVCDVEGRPGRHLPAPKRPEPDSISPR